MAQIGLRGALAALALTLLPLCVAAQTAARSPVSSVSATPSPVPDTASVAPTAPKFTGVLGDFGNGTRSAWAGHGLLVYGHLFTETAANLSGGLPLGGTAYQRGTAAASELALGFDLDFDMLNHGSGAGTLHFLLATHFGSDLSAQAIGNLAAVQEAAGDQTVHIAILEYEQSLAKGRLNLLIGRYDQQADFLPGISYWGPAANCRFQNENICGTPFANPINNGVVANGYEGYAYYPSSEWGARLRAGLGSGVYVQAAVVQGNPIAFSTNHGLNLEFNGGTGVDLPVEIGVSLKDRHGNLVGDIRVGGYYDTSNVENFATRATYSLALSPFETNAAGLASNAAALASIKSTYVRGRSGEHVVIDHIIGGGAGAGQSGTAIFASGAISDPQSSLVSTTFDIGIVRNGTFRGRPNDTIDLAFATDDYNVRLQKLEKTLQSEGFAVPNTVQDQAIELNYGLQATSWFTLRPGLQYVIHPGGVTTNPGAGVLNPPRNALVIGVAGILSL